jgi:amino acid transporter
MRDYDDGAASVCESARTASGVPPLMSTRVAPSATDAPGSGIEPVLFVGFGVASIGGPIALLTLLPGAAGESLDSAGLVVLLALVLFAAPLAIWLAYSRRIVSPGGLSAFVDAAAGRRTALAQGWIWAFAYFLYLPYTITFVVYDLLTPVFPGITPYRSALELVLPVLIVAVVLAPVRLVLAGLGVLAAAQLGVMLVLAAVVHSHVGSSFASQPHAHGTGKAAASTALLFLCASLPLYLGAEVRGGSRTVRFGLATAVGLVGAVFLLAAIPLSGVPDELRDAAVPGAAVARAYSGRELEVVVGLFTAASTLALIVAEYLALARLLHWLHGPPVRTIMYWIAVPFVLADAISLVSPERFYSDLLKPSLAALFVSQLIVFVVFPRFRRGAIAVGVAAVASGLMVWGLYTLFAAGAST